MSLHWLVARCGMLTSTVSGRFVGALDQGTSSSRFVVFDRDGTLVSIAHKEHAQIYPRPGWVEHDPLEIWTSCTGVIGEALASAGLVPSDLVAAGITSQRETTVVWDRRDGRPIYNAIVWQDTRTDAICARLSAGPGGADRYRERTGLPIATYFSGPKLRWILDNVDGARAMAADGHLLFGTMDTWCLWNLTGGTAGGVHITDVTNASRTQLMNINTLEWDDELLDELEVPRSLLPEIRPSVDLLATATGALDGVALAADLGDQHAALFGQCCFDPGDAKNTYGTGCFLLTNTGATPVRSQSGLLTTLGFRIAGQPPVYALEGSIAITGALVQWLRDNLGLIRSAGEIEALAGTVTDNGGIYFVPAFSGLFAPHWRSDARGVIAGLTRQANKGHLARAVLEATAWQTREVVDAMNADLATPLRELKVDGGMVQNQLLMQMQADALGIPVIRPRIIETTALGAAYGAGLATGFWESLDSLRTQWGEEQRWLPSIVPGVREHRFREWKKAVSRTLNWAESNA